jgi:hypothetical protein
MINNVVLIACAGVGIYLFFGLLRAILRSKTLLITAIYFGGYAYYNKEWPSIETTIEHLKGLFMVM